MIVEVASGVAVSEVTVKVPVVAPAATVTEAGTVAADVLLDVRLTTNPPTGAAELSVTVPVELPIPPVTDVGLSDTAVNVGGLTVSVAVAVVAPWVPVMVTDF